MAITMVAALSPAVSPAAAFAAEMGVGAGFTAGPNDTSLSGTQVYYGSFSGSPIRWYVVKAEDETATLWTTATISSRYYEGTAPLNHNDWSGSDVCAWLNGTGSYTGDGFLQSAFSGRERAAMVQQYSSVPEQGYSGGQYTPNQTVVLPSENEVKDGGDWGMSASSRMTPFTSWWLRTPGTATNQASYVSSATGAIGNNYDVDMQRSVCPIFKLDTSSVVFSSAASGAGAKPASAGSALSAVTAPTGAVKLTIADAGLTLACTDTASRTVEDGDVVSIEYSGATTGTNNYISCVIENSGGTILYYGKLASASTAPGGTASFVVPSALATGAYTIKLFCEEANANNLTDFCGTPISIQMSVTNTPPTLSAGTIDRTSDTAATIGFSTNEEGVAYYLVKNSGDTSPTSTEVKAGTSLGAVSAGAVANKAIVLTAGAKDVYVVVEDQTNQISAPLKIAAPAYELPPVLTAGTATRADQANATATFSSSKAGEYYYMIVDSYAAQPAIETGGAGTTCGASLNTIELTGLTPGSKDIYIVVKDAANKVSAADFRIGIPAYGLAEAPDLAGTQVYFGDYTGGASAGPLKWYVVQTDSVSAALWTPTSVASRAYDSAASGGAHKNWSGSEICAWLNGTGSFTSDGFLPNAFSSAERDAITLYGTTDTGTVGNIYDINQRIVLPSTREIGGVNGTGRWGIPISNAMRNTGVAWWLRTPGNPFTPSEAACVRSDGAGQDSTNVTGVYSIRPALRLDLSSVLFPSAVSGVGAKSSATVGGGFMQPGAPADIVKLTIKDGNALSLAGITATTASTGAVTFNYTGATAGKTLSAVIMSNGGVVKHYGKLATVPAGGSGSASLTTPEDFVMTDTIWVFVEEINGDSNTDYASIPINLAENVPVIGGVPVITVDPPTGKMTASVTGDSGTYSYSWSVTGQDVPAGTADGNTYTPVASELGKEINCRIEKDGAFGYLSISEKAYRVDVSLEGEEAGDSAAVAGAYGKAGDTVGIVYTVGTSGSYRNNVAFTGGTVTGTESPAMYTIDGGDAQDGVITITAVFSHIDLSDKKYYVKPGGSDLGEGDSWGAAYATLQKAIDMALPGDEVYVAAGTYYPTKKAAETDYDGAPATDRDMAFVLPGYVKIFGGYNAQSGVRDAKNNVTVLSGDIGAKGDNTDNVYHVVIAGPDARNAVLDGFTITGGNANDIDGGSIVMPGDLMIYRSIGGGIYNWADSFTIANCVISGNAARDGGGMHNYGEAVFTNCVFKDNTATMSGGGLYNSNNDSVFANCVFTGNKTTGTTYGGAGMCVLGGSPVIVNCLFADNSATVAGGGFYSHQGSPKLVNNTITNNTAPAGNGGGAYYAQNAGSNPAITNCIITGNAGGDAAQSGSGGSITYKATIIGGVSYDADGIAAPLSGGALFIGGDYRLAAGSPAINKGINAPGVTIPDTDLSGKPRIVNKTIDMGAYEFQNNVLISVSPSHAILKNDTDPALFTATLSPEGEDYDSVNWSIWPAGAESLLVLPVDMTGQSIVLRAESAAAAGTVQVRATYLGYTATTTLEILPGGIVKDPVDPKDPTKNSIVKLLENKVAVNPYKVTGGAIGIEISNRGISTLSDGRPAGSRIVELDGVELFTVNNKKAEVPLKTYTANMSESNGRHVEIHAVSDKSPNVKKVGMKLLPHGGDPDDDWIYAEGTFDISLSKKYPKINIKTSGNLNKSLLSDKVSLTVTSPDGLCEITEVETGSGNYFVNSVGGIDIDNVSGHKAELFLTGTPALAHNKTYKPKIKVSVAGYKTAYSGHLPEGGGGIAFNVKVVNTTPKLKLSAKNIAVSSSRVYDEPPAHHPAVIMLQSNDKSVATADMLEKIADNGVSFEGKTPKGGAPYDGIGLIYDKYNGALLIWPKENAAGGSGNIVVTFKNSGAVVKLPLTVTFRDDSKLSVSTKTKAFTMHLNHARNSEIVKVPVTVNAVNVYSDSWYIVSTGSGSATQPFGPGHPLFGAIEATGVLLDMNKAVLRTADDPEAETKLAEWFAATANGKNNNTKNKKIVLNIGSPDIPGKTFAVTLTVTKSGHSATAKLSGSGKINVAVPGAYTTATLTLKNTSSPIAKVDWPKTPENDFVLGSITGPGTFTVHLKPDRPVKMAAQTVRPVITLENGQVVTPALKLTPVFTASKKTQSASAVTLHKSTPYTGAALDLDIATPAGAKLGAVAIDPAGYAKLGFKDGKGLQLVQSGANTWVIAFDDYTLPEMKPDKKGKAVSLKSGYSLKIQLWAEGTYVTDAFGNPAKDAKGNIIPLYNTAKKPKAITKPTVVTVKVNIVTR